jgi:hypothetical protein
MRSCNKLWVYGIGFVIHVMNKFMHEFLSCNLILFHTDLLKTYLCNYAKWTCLTFLIYTCVDLEAPWAELIGE